MQSLAPGQLRPRHQSFSLEHPAQLESRLDHDLPADTLARIKIEDEQIGMLDVIDVCIPGVKLDCPNLD